MDDTDEKAAEQMALFRYGLIARILPTDLSAQQHQQEMLRIVAEEHQIPCSLRTRVAHSAALRELMHLHRQGGFNALKPRRRMDTGHPRKLAPALSERLLQVKEQEPDLSVRLIIKQVQQEPDIDTPVHSPCKLTEEPINQSLVRNSRRNGRKLTNIRQVDARGDTMQPAAGDERMDDADLLRLHQFCFISQEL